LLIFFKLPTVREFLKRVPRQSLKQSLAISQEIGDRAGEGTTLNNIAGIYHANDDYETALNYLEQSLPVGSRMIE